MSAFRVNALKHRIATDGQSAAEHFDHVIDNGGAHAVFVLLVKAPSCAAFLEECFEPDWKSNRFLLSESRLAATGRY